MSKYLIVNIDKREFIDPENFLDNREELIMSVRVLRYLLAGDKETDNKHDIYELFGRWKGDRIIFAEENAEPLAYDFEYETNDRNLYKTAEELYDDISIKVMALMITSNENLRGYFFHMNQTIESNANVTTKKIQTKFQNTYKKALELISNIASQPTLSETRDMDGNIIERTVVQPIVNKITPPPETITIPESNDPSYIDNNVRCSCTDCQHKGSPVPHLPNFLFCNSKGGYRNGSCNNFERLVNSHANSQ